MHQNETEKPASTPLWTTGLFVLSSIGGFVAFALGIERIQNYFHPYYFGILISGLGLFLGIFMSIKLKARIPISQKLKNNYATVSSYITVGVTGIFLLLGTYMNQGLSKLKERAGFEILDKYQQERQFRRAERNILIVKINGEAFRLICEPDYWQQARIGQKVELCLYTSNLGFDYVVVEP